MSDSDETAWRAAYIAAFVRIAVAKGYWTDADAKVWAEETVSDAYASASDCSPAEVAAEDVEVCRRDSRSV
jgi:hypothetical protein